MRHLLGIEEMSRDEIERVLETSEAMLEISQREIKRVPTLRGRTVINVFLESSTRTRVSFEIAAKRLSADAINVTRSGSSLSKAETLADMARNLAAMSADVLVVRDSVAGVPHMLALNKGKHAVLRKGLEILPETGAQLAAAVTAPKLGDGKKK